LIIILLINIYFKTSFFLNKNNYIKDLKR